MDPDDLLDAPDAIDKLLAEAAKNIASLPPAPADDPAPSLDPLCQAIVAEVPQAVGVALVALPDGAVVGHFSAAGFAEDFVADLGRQTAAMFRGPDVQHIEDRVRAHRGLEEAVEPYVEEITIGTRHTAHFARVLGSGRYVLMVVTARRAGREQTWRRINGLVGAIEQNLP